METLLEPVNIEALRERGLRESVPEYKVRNTNIGRRHQQFRYFMWLVCPEYLSSLSDNSVKCLENTLLTHSTITNINQLVSQAEQFVKRHPEGIEVEGKNVPKVKGHIRSKINRKFRESGSRFIDEYLGIKIPAYSTVVPRFYKSIINHCVKSPSKQSTVCIVQEAAKDAQPSYQKVLPPITSRAQHLARYFCGLICEEYYSGLLYNDQQALEETLMDRLDLSEVVRQSEQFVLKHKRSIDVDVKVVPIRTADRAPKADEQYKREASKFIQNYLGIKIPPLKDLSPDFYESIIYHNTTSVINQTIPNYQELIKIS